MSTLERGFKSWAERVASGIRRDLNLQPEAPLSARTLAQYLGVELWTPDDVPNLPREVRRQLLELDPSGWSAVTQEVGGQATIIFNPKHSLGRQAADIVHELAHLLLDHEPGMMILSNDGTTAMRTFNPKQEAEASWLSGCLLLPRPALLMALRGGRAAIQIAEEYGVSEKLAVYRIRISGVEAQVRAARARYSARARRKLATR